MRRLASYLIIFFSFLVLLFKLKRHKPARSQKTKILLVLSSWQMSPVPFFTIIYGILLRTQGIQVRCLFVPGNFSPNKFFYFLERNAIKLAMFASSLKTLQPAQKPLTSDVLTADLLSRYATLNTIWQERAEYSKNFANELARFEGLLTSYKQIFECYAIEEHDVVFCGGGVTGVSGLLYEFCKHHDTQFVTFDSSAKGPIITSVNGRACKLDDIPTSLAHISNDNYMHQQKIQDVVKKEIRNRQLGDDIFGYQKNASAIDKGEAYDIVIAMNSTWDSAVLGSNRLFENNLDWIKQTVSFIVAHTSYNVIIRQHPAEAKTEGLSNVNYRDALAEELKSSRVRFVDATETINSYSLIADCKLVIFSTSTIGLESILMGKAVLSPSVSYLTKAHLLNLPSSKEAYFNSITHLETCVCGTMAMAETLYLLSQRFNWIETNFSTSNAKFWYKLNYQKIMADDGVKDYLSAIIHNKPVSLLRYQDWLHVRNH